MLQSVAAFIRAHTQESDEWSAELPLHVESTYKLSSERGYLQIPAFLALGSYPDVDAPASELSHGISMVGQNTSHTWVAAAH